MCFLFQELPSAILLWRDMPATNTTLLPLRMSLFPHQFLNDMKLRVTVPVPYFQLLKNVTLPFGMQFLMRNLLSFELVFSLLRRFCFSRCFQDCFVFSLQRFDYDVLWRERVWVYSTWGFVQLLKSVGLHLLSNLGIHGHYFFKYFSNTTLFSPLLLILQRQECQIFILPHVSDDDFSPQSILSLLFKIG